MKPIPFSLEQLSTYPVIKKQVFKLLASLKSNELNEKQGLLNVLQGKFLKSAREYRDFDIEEVSKKTGLSQELVYEIELGLVSAKMSDFFSLCSHYGIIHDGETFVQLAENAKNSELLKKRIESSKTLMAYGFPQLRDLEKYYPSSEPNGKVLEFRPRI